MPLKKQISGALPAGRSEQATQEPMCARCGSSATWEDCDNCEGGFSYHDCGEDTCCCLYPEDNVICDRCLGKGGWHVCLSDGGWCHDHPLPGREKVQRGEVVYV